MRSAGGGATAAPTVVPAEPYLPKRGAVRRRRTDGRFALRGFSGFLRSTLEFRLPPILTSNLFLAPQLLVVLLGHVIRSAERLKPTRKLTSGQIAIPS